MKYQIIISTLSILFAISGCKTEFSVNGEYQKTAIVNAIIDFNDTIHYLKINKTFLGDGNAFDFAAIPDSSYFSSVDGTVKEVVNGTVNRTFTLRDTLIENKDESGVFYAPQQRLYYFYTAPNEKLDKDAILRLNLNLDNGDNIVTGETELVSGLSIESPNDFTPLALAEALVEDDTDYLRPSISFKTGTSAQYFDLRIIFRYNEFEGTNNTIKEFEWKVADLAKDQLAVSPNNQASIVLNGKNFYEQVAAKISIDPAVTRRTVHSLDFVLTGGSQDLVNYIAVNQPVSSLAQSKPTFTNLSGGLGIFTSRSKVVRTRLNGVPNGPATIRILNQNSTRQLCQGQITTNELLFCSPIPEDQNSTFFCN